MRRRDQKSPHRLHAPFSRLLVVPLASWLAFAGIYACTSSDKAKDAGAALSPEEQKALDDYKSEIEIGRSMAGRLLAFYGTNGNEPLIGYVNQVGNYVASYSDFPERRYMFAILDDDTINAFACPGGYILVTLGAVRAAKNEAELAAVLGHEVAHVGKRHMFNTLKAMEKKELEANAKAAEQSKKFGHSLRMRERPKPEESSTGAELARYLSGSAGAALNLLQAAQAGMNLITEKGLDKELEFEADHEGVKFAIRAGYEPKAMLAYLTRADKGKDKEVKDLEKTHPSVKNRKKQITKLLKVLKAEEIIGATGEERFQKFQKLLPSKAGA